MRQIYCRYNSIEKLIIKLPKFLTDPSYGVAVCELNQQIVSWVAWVVNEHFVREKIRFQIWGLVVSGDHRGREIGKRLIIFVEAIAAQAKAPAIIDLLSGKRRASDGSHAFYQALGYHNTGVTDKLYFRKELS